MSDSKSESQALAPAEKASEGRPPGRLRRWYRHNAAPIHVTLLFSLFLLIYGSPDIFFSVYPGQAGVLWSRFGGGTVTEWVYAEGFHVKFPWDKVYIYNIRIQEERQEITVLSKDGLAIEVELSVRYRVYEEGLAELHKHIGPDYLNVLLIPEVSSLAREHIASFEPEELYTERRAEIEQFLSQAIKRELRVQYESDRGTNQALHVEDVLIRNIALPQQVAEVIEEKLVREQRLLEFDYRLALERKESERKEIEARGIRRFQDIVSEGISEQYLKWKGIDATLELARSQNSKIVVIGTGGDGLPIILGGLDAPLSTIPPQTPPTTPANPTAATPTNPAPATQQPPPQNPPTP